MLRVGNSAWVKFPPELIASDTFPLWFASQRERYGREQNRRRPGSPCVALACSPCSRAFPRGAPLIPRGAVMQVRWTRYSKLPTGLCLFMFASSARHSPAQRRRERIIPLNTIMKYSAWYFIFKHKHTVVFGLACIILAAVWNIWGETLQKMLPETLHVCFISVYQTDMLTTAGLEILLVLPSCICWTLNPTLWSTAHRIKCIVMQYCCTESRAGVTNILTLRPAEVSPTVPGLCTI